MTVSSAFLALLIPMAVAAEPTPPADDFDICGIVDSLHRGSPHYFQCVDTLAEAEAAGIDTPVALTNYVCARSVDFWGFDETLALACYQRALDAIDPA